MNVSVVRNNIRISVKNVTYVKAHLANYHFFVAVVFIFAVIFSLYWNCLAKALSNIKYTLYKRSH